ncbi:hypothetical protein QR97_01885 [Streptomyces sp. PBH53]|nr:hypothetical protein QR97_01885 [Streptomyces sp. PBH53]
MAVVIRLAGLARLRQTLMPRIEVGRLALTDSPRPHTAGTARDMEGGMILIGRVGFALLRRRTARPE